MRLRWCWAVWCVACTTARMGPSPGGQATEPRDWPALAVSGGLSSFGEDPKGDLYLTSLSGSLYRVVAHP